jgi:hypothetical protein
MTTWGEFATAAPELAAFGEGRFREAEVAYVATVRVDGSPRVHPVTPVLCDGRLYLFMEPTSPKGHDLRREPRYAMHSLVTDQDGNPGEFHIKGRGQPVDDPAVRARVAEAAPYEPMERWIVFEFSIEEAASTHYEGKEPVRRRWRAG